MSKPVPSADFRGLDIPPSFRDVWDYVCTRLPSRTLRDTDVRTIQVHIAVWRTLDTDELCPAFAIVEDTVVSDRGTHHRRFCCFPGAYFAACDLQESVELYDTLEAAINILFVELSACREVSRLLIPLDPIVAYLYALYDTLWMRYWRFSDDGEIPDVNLATIRRLEHIVERQCVSIYEMDRVGIIGTTC